MKYLSPQEVLVLHARIIDQTGGLHGIRDVRLLESACLRPQTTFDGKPLYRTAFEKTAALLHSLVCNHPFLDGNKRTAAVAAARMLHLNGYELAATNPTVVSFMLKVAKGETDVPVIAVWLQKHAKKKGR